MDMTHISIGTAGIIVVLGMSVVFFGLILLMWVTQLMSKFFISKNKTAAVEEAAPAAPAPVKAEPAPGTAGELKLYDTDPKDAAMIMAIVADKMGKPLNELRFKSIKEIK